MFVAMIIFLVLVKQDSHLFKQFQSNNFLETRGSIGKIEHKRIPYVTQELKQMTYAVNTVYYIVECNNYQSSVFSYSLLSNYSYETNRYITKLLKKVSIDAYRKHISRYIA